MPEKSMPVVQPSNSLAKICEKHQILHARLALIWNAVAFDAQVSYPQ